MNARLTCAGMLVSGSLFILSCNKDPGPLYDYTGKNTLGNSSNSIATILHTTGSLSLKPGTDALWSNNDSSPFPPASGRLANCAPATGAYSYYNKYHAAQTARTFPVRLHP